MQISRLVSKHITKLCHMISLSEKSDRLTEFELMLSVRRVLFVQVSYINMLSFLIVSTLKS